MVAFDTNVVVRVLVGDDPVQTKKAERAFVEHANGDGGFVSLVVLAEVGWVLAVAYEWDRATIHARTTVVGDVLRPSAMMAVARPVTVSRREFGARSRSTMTPAGPPDRERHQSRVRLRAALRGRPAAPFWRTWYE